LLVQWKSNNKFELSLHLRQEVIVSIGKLKRFFVFNVRKVAVPLAEFQGFFRHRLVLMNLIVLYKVKTTFFFEADENVLDHVGLCET